MLHRLANILLGPVARAAELIADADMRLVIPAGGACAAQPPPVSRRAPFKVVPKDRRDLSGPCG
jgi:hypothetical protein